jgi:tetratricopeptide (TPR) repeat protein
MKKIALLFLISACHTQIKPPAYENPLPSQPKPLTPPDPFAWKVYFPSSASLAPREEDVMESFHGNPKSESSRLAMALIALKKADFGETKKLLDPLVKDSTVAAYLLAIAHLKNNQVGEGRSLLRALLRANKKWVPAYRALGDSYVREGHLDQAYQILLQGLEEVPDDPRLLVGLGVVYLKKEQLEEARSSFQKAQTPEGFVNLAYLAFLDRDLSLALDYAQKALALNPEASESHLILGLILSESPRERWEEAEIALDRALSLDPYSPEARYHLALHLVQKKKSLEKALRLFSEVLDLAGSETPLYGLALGWVRDLG